MDDIVLDVNADSVENHIDQSVAIGTNETDLQTNDQPLSSDDVNSDQPMTKMVGKEDQPIVEKTEGSQANENEHSSS